MQGMGGMQMPSMSGMQTDLSGQGQKKIPNPTNFKIVKCKNFDKGKIYF